MTERRSDMQEIQRQILRQNSEMLERLARIEQRLDNINGEVQDTKSFKHGCPERMDRLSAEVTRLKLQQTKNTIYIGIAVAIVAALSQIGIKFILN